MPSATIGTLLVPGCETNADVIEGVGLCDIQVEEDGAVFEQGINNNALTVKGPQVLFGDDIASKSGKKANANNDSFPRMSTPLTSGGGIEVNSTPSPNSTTSPASTARRSTAACCLLLLQGSGHLHARRRRLARGHAATTFADGWQFVRRSRTLS